MNTSQKISIINKQNESILKSLISKNIAFEREIIPENSSEEETLIILNKENDRLKEVAKQNKPPPQEKPKPQVQPVVQKESKPKKEEDNDEDEIDYEAPKPKFECICNMEDIKRAFFSKEYDTAFELIKAQQFKFYNVEYKFNSDKDGAPDFAAKNLLKGFVRNFDDYRKYFLICFRCFKIPDNKYEYKSVWIVNTNESIQNIIGSLYDDFEFNQVVELDQINQLLQQIIKLPEETEGLVGEAYVH